MDVIEHQAVKIVRNHRIKAEELMVDETIFSMANGILGTRGHFTEGYGGNLDYPQTYMNGVYNTFPYHYEENSIQFPQIGQTIVNLPDASLITIETDCERINLLDAKLIDLYRTYDLAVGLTTRKAHYQTELGFDFFVYEERLVSQVHKDVIVLKLELESPNYEGIITFKSYLRMPNVSRLKTFDPRVGQAKVHLDFVNAYAKEGYAVLNAKTNRTDLKINVGMAHDCMGKYRTENTKVVFECAKSLHKGESVSISKYQVYQCDVLNPKEDVEDLLRSLKKYPEYVEEQARYFATFWMSNPLQLSHHEINEAIQYNIFQLYCSGGEHEHLQIAAKGISGEGYEGHYFWDTEIYMLPYFILNHPEKARKILMFRYHHLEQAKVEARKMGIHRGAKIPWRTINGTEASPYFLAGSAQLHINSDLAFAIMQYYHATLDDRFMLDYGFELLLETAIFIYDHGHMYKDEFHLAGVTGPDEYTVLVDDNYYTNRMAKFHFESVVKYAKNHIEVERILEQRGYDVSLIDDLKHAAEKMCLLVDEEKHLALQDAGFMRKKHLDLKTIPMSTRPMLLHYHPVFIYRHQVLKQSDAILALTLMNEQDKALFKNSFDYYLPITTHDSSLSKCMYGIAAYKLNEAKLAFEYMQDSVEIDLANSKNHTQFGLHMANMGGSYLLVLMGLLGLQINEVLSLSPVYQDEIENYQLSIQFQSTRLLFQVIHNQLMIHVNKPIDIDLFGERIHVDSFHSAMIKLA